MGVLRIRLLFFLHQSGKEKCRSVPGWSRCRRQKTRLKFLKNLKLTIGWNNSLLVTKKPTKGSLKSCTVQYIERPNLAKQKLSQNNTRLNLFFFLFIACGENEVLFWPDKSSIWMDRHSHRYVNKKTAHIPLPFIPLFWQRAMLTLD